MNTCNFKIRNETEIGVMLKKFLEIYGIKENGG